MARLVRHVYSVRDVQGDLFGGITGSGATMRMIVNKRVVGVCLEQVAGRVIR